MLASWWEGRRPITNEPVQDSSPQQPWWGPGRARMLAALLALLGLLALVALASRGHRPFAGGAGGGTGQEPSTLFWDYLFSVALALGVIGAGVVVWALLGARGASPKHKPGQTRVYGLLVFCLLMLAITVAVRSLQRHDAASSGDGRPLLQAPEVRPDQRRQQRSRPPELQWVPVAIVGTTVGLALAYLVARRRYRLRLQNELTDERAHGGARGAPRRHARRPARRAGSAARRDRRVRADGAGARRVRASRAARSRRRSSTSTGSPRRSTSGCPPRGGSCSSSRTSSSGRSSARTRSTRR